MDEVEVLFVSEDQDQYQANTEEGFILLSRSFVDSSLFAQDEPVLRLALYLMTRANWKPGKWFCKYQKKEIVIQRGQIITSIAKLANSIQKMTRGKVRRALNKLLSAGFVKDITPNVVKRANGYILLSIEKYSLYQNQNNYKRTQAFNERSTSVTTNAQRLDTIESLNIKTLNNKESNTLSGKLDFELTPPESKNGFEEIVITYLNEKSGKHFRFTKANKSLIHARMSEGALLIDFKHVVDIKCEEWLGTEQERYLRPETLFSAKHFESYRNQTTTARPMGPSFVSDFDDGEF